MITRRHIHGACRAFFSPPARRLDRHREFKDLARDIIRSIRAVDELRVPIQEVTIAVKKSESFLPADRQFVMLSKSVFSALMGSSAL